MMHSSVQIMRMALGPYLPWTAAAIQELGGLYEIREEDPSNLDRAIHLYEEAIEAFRCNYGEQQYCCDSHFPRALKENAMKPFGITLTFTHPWERRPWHDWIMINWETPTRSYEQAAKISWSHDHGDG
jgi:hypothetical protein